MRRVSAALILLALLLLNGCGLKERLDNVGVTPAPVTAAPTQTVVPSPTPIASKKNPVFVLFADFFAAFSDASAGLFERASSGLVSHKDYLLLMADESELSKLYLTVGMLLYDDSSGAFAGTNYGSYAGTGQLGANGHFSYELETGASYAGRLEDGALFASYTDGESSTELVLKKTPEGFMFWVNDGERTGVCELNGLGLRYESFSTRLYGVSQRETFPALSGVRPLENTAE